MLIQVNPERSFLWNVQKMAVIGPYTYCMALAERLTKARFKNSEAEPMHLFLFPEVEAPEEQIPRDPGPSVPDWENTGKRLFHTQDYDHLSDADVILIYIPIQKKTDSYEPNHDPLLETLSSIAEALQRKPADQVPLLIFESTLAPSTMTSIIKDHFEDYELIEGKDLLLGYSPKNISSAQAEAMDAQLYQLVGGLHPETPKMASHLFRQISLQEHLIPTNCMTAEIIQTLSNACRKVWMAFAREIVRYCDKNDINFFEVRDQVNKELLRASDLKEMQQEDMLPSFYEISNSLLSDDDLLLWWRKIDSGADIANSLFLQSRQMNGRWADQIMESVQYRLGDTSNQHIAILGKTFYFDTPFKQHTPTSELAWKLLKKGNSISLFDPYASNASSYRHLSAMGQHLAHRLEEALQQANYIIVGAPHKSYTREIDFLSKAPHLKGIIDTCNLYSTAQIENLGLQYVGIGKGFRKPEEDFIQFVYRSFLTVATGLANELQELIHFFNRQFVTDAFNTIHFSEVRRLSHLYDKGCIIGSPGEITAVPRYQGFFFHLPACAQAYLNEEV
jgi:nucleotide sugar dehydrogenase